MSLLPRVGLGALLLVLVLAPGLGGFPAGELYGADATLGALRALPILAALLLLPGKTDGSGGPGRVAGWALGAAALWGALSLLVHSGFLTDPTLLFAQVDGALDLAAFLAIFLAARRVASEPRERSWLAIALVLGMAWTAVSVALEYGALVPGSRAQGSFFSPNFTAGLLGACLPVAAALCLDAKERLGALLTGVAAALGFGALIATGSRAGIAMALVGLAVALGLAAFRTGGKLAWGRIGALLAAFCVMAFGFRAAILTRAASGGDQQHSEAFRSWTWKGTLAMAQANPVLGTGPGTFPYRYGPYAKVEWTGLAHSSYLQTAAEDGFPALLAVGVAVGAAVAAGLGRALRKGAGGPDLLLCGAVGGLLVGTLRSFLDTEWSLLGDALPFWALAGIACAAGPPTAAKGKARALPYLFAAPLLVALTASLGGWPTRPGALVRAGDMEGAARIEPTIARFFPLARHAESQGDLNGAVAWFEKARAADPNNQQTLRALAETKEKAGDTAGALAIWKELVDKAEGLSGTVRALPELPEIHPAFAYAALARDAGKRGDAAGAQTLRQKALGVADAYSRITPIYQQMELQKTPGRTVAEKVDRLRQRRADLKALFADDRSAEADAVRGRLDAMDAALTAR